MNAKIDFYFRHGPTRIDKFHLPYGIWVEFHRVESKLTPDSILNLQTAIKVKQLLSLPQLWKKEYLFLASISQGGNKKFKTAWFVAMQIFIFHFLPRIVRVAHKSPYFNGVKENSPHIISQIDIDEQISQQWLNGCYCRVIFYQLSMLTAPSPLQNPVPNKNEHVYSLYATLVFL